MVRRAPLDPASLPLLLLARARIVSDGWHPFDRPDRWTLVSAVADGTLPGWHALQLLRELAGTHNLVAWNQDRFRIGSDVVELLDRAIREVGGTPPRTRYREPRRRGGRAGGWNVSHN